MNYNQLFHIFLYVYGIPLVILPTLGGGFVFAGFRLVRVPGADFWKCWKVYLAGCCYAFLVLVMVTFGLPRSDLSDVGRRAVQAGVFCGMQLLLIPLLLWANHSKRLRTAPDPALPPGSSRRMFVTAGVAILLTNLVTLGILMAMPE